MQYGGKWYQQKKWDRDAEEIFRSIFAKGIMVILSLEEDRRVLNNEPVPTSSRKQGLKQIDKTTTEVCVSIQASFPF